MLKIADDFNQKRNFTKALSNTKIEHKETKRNIRYKKKTKHSETTLNFLEPHSLYFFSQHCRLSSFSSNSVVAPEIAQNRDDSNRAMAHGEFVKARIKIRAMLYRRTRAQRG